MAITNSETFWFTYRWRITLSSVSCLLFLLWLFWPNQIDLPPQNVSTSSIPSDEELQRGGFCPLPFEESSDKPLPGRPDVPMPISSQIYDNAELSINGVQVSDEPIVLKAGSKIHFRGVITANPNMPKNMVMDGHIGWVSRADNDHGWMIRWPDFYGGNTSQRRCVFEGDHVVPNEPGEYLLIVFSSAHIEQKPHFALMAGEFRAVIQ